VSTQPKPRISPEQYLALERQADHKSEYFDGGVFPMPGATKRHNMIVSNIVISVGAQLKDRPYWICSNDLRLRVSPTGLYTYPDVIVVAGDGLFADDQKDTLLNPALIVEVLSESTRDYDRGEKFAQYRTLASLAEYLLVAQEKPHVEHYVRQADGSWLLRETSRVQDTIHLSVIQCRLPLAEIYQKIEFDS